MTGIVFGQTQKGKRKLIDPDGLSYILKVVSKNTKAEYWKCTVKKCHGRFIYYPDTGEGKLSAAHTEEHQVGPTWRAKDAAIERLRELTLTSEGGVKAVGLVRKVLEGISPEVRSLLPPVNQLVDRVKRWAKSSNIQLVKADPEDYLIPEGDEILNGLQKSEDGAGGGSIHSPAFCFSTGFGLKEHRPKTGSRNRMKLLKRIDEEGNEIGTASLNDFIYGTDTAVSEEAVTMPERCADKPLTESEPYQVAENDSDGDNDDFVDNGGDDFQMDDDCGIEPEPQRTASELKFSRTVSTCSKQSTKERKMLPTKETVKSGERCFVCGDELIVCETLASSEETFRKACCYLNVKSEGTWFPRTENSKFYSFCKSCTNEIMRIHSLYIKVEEIQSMIFKKVETVEKRIADAEIVDNWMADAPHSTAVRFEGFRKQVMINYRNKLKLRREIRFGKKTGETFTEVLPSTSAHMFACDPVDTDAFKKLATESTINNTTVSTPSKMRACPKSKKLVKEIQSVNTLGPAEDTTQLNDFSDNDVSTHDFDDCQDAESVSSERETKFWQDDPRKLETVQMEASNKFTSDVDNSRDDSLHSSNGDNKHKEISKRPQRRQPKTKKSRTSMDEKKQVKNSAEPEKLYRVKDSYSRKIKFPDAVLTKDGRVFMEGIEIIKNPPGAYKLRPYSVSFSCGACGKIHLTFWHVRQHICGHHLHMFKCHICKKEFTDPKVVDRHVMMKHETPRYENCPICGKPVRMFNSQRQMNCHRWCHLSQAEKQDPKYRSWCPNPEKYNLTSRQDIEKQSFMCGQCGKSFLLPSALKRHEMKHDAPPQEKKEMVMCQFCGKTFTSRTGLSRHTPNCKSNDQRHPSKMYPCPKCPTRFTTANARNRHVKKIHNKNNMDLPFSCPKCPRRFSTRNGFKHHKRVCVDGEMGYGKRNTADEPAHGYSVFKTDDTTDNSLSPTTGYNQGHAFTGSGSNSQFDPDPCSAAAVLGYSYNFIGGNSH